MDYSWSGREKLADFELANLPIGALLHLSLRQDTQMLVLGKGCMAGALVQLCKGIRPIRSAGDIGRQCSYCLLHGGCPDLIGIYPYQGYTVILSPQSVSCANQEIGYVIAGFLDIPPDF